MNRHRSEWSVMGLEPGGFHREKRAKLISELKKLIAIHGFDQLVTELRMIKEKEVYESIFGSDEMNMTARNGKIWVLTEKGHARSLEAGITNREIGKPLPGGEYDVNVPSLWVEQGYVEEVER